MRAPAFWWRPPGLAAALLAPAGALYGAVAAARLARPGVRAPVPVVCVGNPTVGGAGKTPTALALADLLAGMGRRPVFLTRGYGGRLAGPHVVDPARDSARDVGDEPLLLAARAPTVVARERPAGAALAVGLGDVVVMDDGFQNPALAKTLSLLVVDGAVGLGNGRVLPAGPLRAPLGPQLARARALVVVEPGPASAAVERVAAAAGLVVLRARLVPEPIDLPQRLLAFAGIGRPDKFAATLAALGRAPLRLVPFADHHAYDARDAAALLAEAKRLGATLVTTAKDAARLAGEPALADLAAATRVVRIRLQFDDVDAVRALLAAALTPAGRRTGGA